jgi:hypothetical protein
MESEKYCTKEIGLNCRRHNGRKTTWDIGIGVNGRRDSWKKLQKKLLVHRAKNNKINYSIEILEYTASHV